MIGQELVERQAGIAQPGKQRQWQAQQTGFAQRDHVVAARLWFHGRAFSEPLAVGHTQKCRMPSSCLGAVQHDEAGEHCIPAPHLCAGGEHGLALVAAQGLDRIAHLFLPSRRQAMEPRLSGDETLGTWGCKHRIHCAVQLYKHSALPCRAVFYSRVVEVINRQRRDGQQARENPRHLSGARHVLARRRKHCRLWPNLRGARVLETIWLCSGHQGGGRSVAGPRTEPVCAHWPR